MVIKASSTHEISGRQIVLNALEGIAKGLQPEPLPESKRYHVAAYISAEQETLIRKAATNHGLDVKDTVERFAYALFQFQLRGKGEVIAEPVRTEQDRLQRVVMSEIERGLEGNQVVIVEASTGFGKSKIFANTTQRILKEDKKAVVWLAAPTISVVAQLVVEFQKWAPEIIPVMLLGQNNFISEVRLRALMDALFINNDGEAMAARSDVETWIEDGCPPITAFSKQLAKVIPGLSHLFDDLQELAPIFAQKSVQISSVDGSDADEDAAHLLREMAEEAASAKLVVCTHAMLFARTMFLKDGEAAPFSYLLVDEVHELEDWAARMQHEELSLFGLRTWIRGAKVSRGPELAQIIDHLIRRLKDSTLRDGQLITESRYIEIREALEPVLAAMKRVRNGDDRERSDLIHSLSRIVLNKEHRVGVSFSPVRRYPTIFAGPQTVKKILEKQWDNAKFALGMSGTIFVPRTAVELTAGYILAKLGVPSGRSRIVGPIATSWVFGSAKLFVPDETLVPDFCYPGRDDQPGDEESELAPSDKYEAWCETISAAVAMAAKSAAGGTLVLCTSFHDIEGIAKNLSRSLGSRLMKHERGVSIQMQKERFIAEAKDNTKPVWLATGAAWVGLNITDVHERAEDDFCLTDLVVVRAPMSLNRTSTHFTRRRSWGMLADIFEAAIRFRQGLGRLIRRQGLADRRIWLLDGRLFDRQFPMFNRLLPVLSPYEKKYFSKLTSDR